MNCAEVQKLLSAYHDGESMPDAHYSVAEHLKGCSECATVLANFQQLADLSGELSHPEPPEQWDDIQEQLAAAVTVQQIARNSATTSNGRPDAPLK